MVSTRKDTVNVLCAYIGDVMEGSPRLFVIQAKLTVLAIARGKDVTFTGKHEGMIPTSGDVADGFRDQVLH